MEMNLDMNNFEEKVEKSTVPVLVDFFADWCGPCKIMGPIVSEIAKETEGKAVVGKINVDENAELAEEFNIMSIPTIIIFKDGKPAEKFVGVTSKEEILAKLI